MKYCALIPVYNNHQTIGKVIDECKNYISDILVVNDGSTDGTKEIIESKAVRAIHHSKNKGKGAALKTGFNWLLNNNYDYAVTIDADGQHFPLDIPRFIDKSKENPGSLIIGNRRLAENVGSSSKIGLFFSNFFFMIATFYSGFDTQSGYRLYPIKQINKLKLNTNAYDFELEVIIRASWSKIPLTSIDIDVHYDPPEKRVSHFDKKADGWRSTKLIFRLLVVHHSIVILTFPWILIKKVLKK